MKALKPKRLLMLLITACICSGCSQTTDSLTADPNDAAKAAIEELGGKYFADSNALFLNDTQIADAGLEHLKGLSSLQVLHLSGTQITDAGLEYRKVVHCEVICRR